MWGERLKMRVNRSKVCSGDKGWNDNDKWDVTCEYSNTKVNINMSERN
jgi:hypothetical protein